jgi:hypothetical protein
MESFSEKTADTLGVSSVTTPVTVRSSIAARLVCASDRTASTNPVTKMLHSFIDGLTFTTRKRAILDLVGIIFSFLE